MTQRRRMSRRALLVSAGLLTLGTVTSIVVAAILELTFEDFHVPGTQMGMVSTSAITPTGNCRVCHGDFDAANEPYATWSGSLMGQAGRDPLFFAQMALANQDVSFSGYYCLRCHVPSAIVSGHAMPADGSALDSYDSEGVSCHFCHSMIDPVYRPGVSPVEDEPILAALGADKPDHYGNAMFVLDPEGRRRSARPDPTTPHEFIRSNFHRTGDFCGTCHEVGNVATTRQPDGTYRYNAIGEPSPTGDPAHQFPLERTYTEWKLSAFASGGVDMAGRFGGVGAGVVSTCQDCHMPRAAAKICFFGNDRPDVRRHEFAGAAAPVLDIIAAYTRNDPAVNQSAIAQARAASVSMLERAASLEASATGPTLNVRVINESGHKLPTGHIEGRRVWINVQYRNRAGELVAEYGGYDAATATLDEGSTTVYEMHVGLSAAAAAVTGLTAGPTARMALADTIVKDNRIPPRGFANDTYAAGGAPVVGAGYADGQYWDDRAFAVPHGAVAATVSIYYQNTPREYIEHLRDANTTNHWGQTLHDLWTSTGRGAPIRMATTSVDLNEALHADVNHSGRTDLQDLFDFLAMWFSLNPGADFDGSGAVSVQDIFDFLQAWFQERS